MLEGFKDIHDLTTTEEITAAYEENILLYIAEYEHEKKVNLHDVDQMRWNALLLYLYKHVFAITSRDKKLYNEKSNIDYSNKELLDNVCDIYIGLCYEYSKEISILGFSKLTGITQDTIFEWHNNSINYIDINDSNNINNNKSDIKNDNKSSSLHTKKRRGSSEIWKKLNREREETLSNILVSGKIRNPVGVLGVLNRHYGWNMGQPRNEQPRLVHRSAEEIARDIGLDMQEPAGLLPEESRNL